MRIVDKVPFLILSLMTLFMLSCNPTQREELDREFERHAYINVIGPYHITSVVAMSANGLPIYSIAATDLGWRIACKMKTSGNPKGIIATSPFAVPDPNRPFKIEAPGK